MTTTPRTVCEEKRLPSQWKVFIPIEVYGSGIDYVKLERISKQKGQTRWCMLC